MAAPAFAADPMTPSAPSSGMPGDSAPAEQSGTISKDELIGRRVIDPQGKDVGKVKDIQTDSQGNATDLVVATGKKDVLVPTTEVQVASNAVVTTKSAKEISKLPAAPKGSTPSPSSGSGSTTY